MHISKCSSITIHNHTNTFPQFPYLILVGSSNYYHVALHTITPRQQSSSTQHYHQQRHKPTSNEERYQYKLPQGSINNSKAHEDLTQNGTIGPMKTFNEPQGISQIAKCQSSEIRINSQATQFTTSKINTR